jgi:DNA-binding transcriptional MocR family regulator
MIAEIRERLVAHTARGLADAVSRGVRDGVFAPDTALPPIRAIATGLGVSPTTVSAAWALLTRAGVIYTDGRRGTKIASQRGSAPTRYQRATYHLRLNADLSLGLPDPALLPDLKPALGRLRDADPLRTYLETYLDEPVLPELTDYLDANWPFRADQLTITDGVADALDLVLTTLVRYGDRVAVERVTTPPLLDLLEASGANLIPLDLDAAGVRPDSLSAALDAGARMVFLQPRGQHPTGACVTPERAASLAAILRPADALVIEHDLAGDVASTPMHSLGAHLPERTIHVRGYASAFGPELRSAAIGGPAAEMDALIGRRHLGRGWTSRLLQFLMFDLLTQPDSVRQVRRARREYARRRAALIAELAKRGVVAGGEDGMYVWIPVHNEAAALVSLTSRGIAVAPGSAFSVEPGGEPHIVVTSAVLPADRVVDIAAALAEAANPRPRAGRR